MHARDYGLNKGDTTLKWYFPIEGSKAESSFVKWLGDEKNSPAPQPQMLVKQAIYRIVNYWSTSACRFRMSSRSQHASMIHVQCLLTWGRVGRVRLKRKQHGRLPLSAYDHAPRKSWWTRYIAVRCVTVERLRARIILFCAAVYASISSTWSDHWKRSWETDHEKNVLR